MTNKVLNFKFIVFILLLPSLSLGFSDPPDMPSGNYRNTYSDKKVPIVYLHPDSTIWEILRSNIAVSDDGTENMAPLNVVPYKEVLMRISKVSGTCDAFSCKIQFVYLKTNKTSQFDATVDAANKQETITNASEVITRAGCWLCGFG